MDADFVAGSAGTNPDEPHPPPERLAALADEPPTPVEARHLAGCLSCRAEVESYQSLLALARAERDRLSEPLTDWKSLSGVLAHAGLIATEAPSHRHAGPPRLRAWVVRSAAAVLLVAGGVAAGRFSVRQNTPDHGIIPTIVDQLSDIKAPPSQFSTDTSTQSASGQARFASADDALAAVLNAETAYRHAVAYLMVADSADKGTGIPDDYQTRLAALDEVARTTRAAMYRAPHDDVLRRVYLTSVDARDATLRELGQTIPASLRGGRY